MGSSGQESRSNAGDLLRAQAHIWSHVASFVNSMSLKCAIKLGIPDTIHNHGGSVAFSELMLALTINPVKSHGLRRLMRILVHSGFFELVDRQGEEAYSLNQVSELLIRENRLSLSPFVLTVLDRVITYPWHDLDAWFRDDVSTPFHTTHGVELWEYAGRDPRLNNSFNDGLASDTGLISTVLIDEAGKGIFGGIESLVDVGGGTGTMAKAIVNAYPEIECAVLDLPHVVSSLITSKDLIYVPGDMFKEIPPADAILLKSILHDWSDEESVKILKRGKEAIAKSSSKQKKVIVIDMVMGNSNQGKEGMTTQLAFDMMMMVLVTGKERTETEWAKLFGDSGFSDYKITPILGLRSLIEVYP